MAASLRKHSVRMPNGELVPFEAPDGTPKLQLLEIAKSAVRMKWKKPPPEPNVLDSIKGAGKMVLRAANALRPTVMGRQGAEMARSRPEGLSGDIADRIAARTGSRLAGNLAGNAVNLAPGAGEGVGVADTLSSFKRGDYLGAGINAVATGLGLAPVAGDAAAATMKAMFLGPMAKNADLNALKRAQSALEAGGDPNGIRKVTGWFKGADDNWRYEIDDTPMTIARKRGNLGEVVHHPELFEAYPELKGISLAGQPGKGGALQQFEVDGERVPGGVMSVGAQASPAQQRSVIAHETQHGIQSIEGWARGGTSNEFRTMPANDANAALVLRRIMERKGGNDTFDEAVAAYTEMLGEPPSSLAMSAARQMDEDVLRTAADPASGYRRLAGEVEARNVQTRLNMSAKRRRANAPWETEDVAPEDQIVRFRP